MKKKAAKIARKKTVHNFNTAKTVCLTFEGSLAANVKYIKEFRTYLDSAGLDTYMLAYTDMEDIPGELVFLHNATIFCKKDLDFFFRPKKSVSGPFLEHKFDILIDLSYSMYFPLTYLFTLSPSTFKTGNYTEEQNDYDLMINTADNTSVDYLIEQIKHYISILNNPAVQSSPELTGENKK